MERILRMIFAQGGCHTVVAQLYFPLMIIFRKDSERIKKGKKMTNRKQVVLVVMDGVGFSKTGLGDAVTTANTPVLNEMLKT